MENPIMTFRDVLIYSLKPEEYTDLYNNDEAKITFVNSILNFASYTRGKKITIHIFFPIETYQEAIKEGR